MKRLSFLFLALILATISCIKKDENILDTTLSNESILSEFTSNLTEDLNDSAKLKVTFDGLTKPNQYTTFALKNYSQISEYKRTTLLKSANVNDTELKAFIESLPKPSCFDFPMAEIEKSIFLTIVNALQGKTALQVLAMLDSSEEFVSSKICDDGQKERLLYIIGILRIGPLLSTGKIDFSTNNIQLKSARLDGNIIALQGADFDYCYDNCMRKKYSNYNTIDWIKFAINPPADVLWNAASCTWDCAWASSSTV